MLQFLLAGNPQYGIKSCIAPQGPGEIRDYFLIRQGTHPLTKCKCHKYQSYYLSRDIGFYSDNMTYQDAIKKHA
jgi:hypothetical protein